MKKAQIMAMAMAFLVLSACSSQPDAVLEGVFWPTQDAIAADIVLDEIWTTTEIPVSCSICANDCFIANHGEDIYITLENNVITRASEYQHHEDVLRTAKGRIVGANKGEWGGSVRFIPRFGAGYTLINDNFCGFYVINDRVFALTGLAHLTLDFGAIHELSYKNGKWTAQIILDLESEPKAYIVVDETLYVVTGKDLLIVKNDEIVKSIPGRNGWFAAYPNSIVVADSTLYMGLRHGMFAIDLECGDLRRYFLNTNPNE